MERGFFPDSPVHLDNMLHAHLPSRYRILEEIGQGGMAVVYRAEDETLKREVAVKVLHPHLLAEAESKARLEREARAVAKLKHDNILQIFDFSGGEEKASYIVTEFVDGETLRQFFSKRKSIVPEIAALIVIELGEALQHAHTLGIIHRDIKPENVMLRKDGVLKLMDFGVAQVLDLERMTVTGQLLGSPAYLAPEILEGKISDCRSDVFSVGVMLYELSTGHLPFSGKNPHEVLKRISEGKFVDPRTLNRLISDSFAKTIARSLARNPENRYSSAGELVEELRRYVHDAGLSNPKSELRNLITSPVEYESNFIPRVVTALANAGKAEQQSKRSARALELWNRALSFDPKNDIVLQELERLENKERVQKFFRLGFLLLLGAGLTIVCVRVIGRDSPSNSEVRIANVMPSEKEVKKQTVPQAIPTPAAPPLKSGTIEVPSPSLEQPSSPEPKKVTIPGKSAHALRSSKEIVDTIPSPSASTVILSLGVSPARVEVLLDGTHALDFGPQKNRVEIPWDKSHVLEFRNDACCYRKQVVVGPKAFRPPNDHLFVSLDPKPAMLTVKQKSPAGLDTLLIREVDPGSTSPWRTQSQLDEQIIVPFTAGGEMRKKLEIVAFRKDKVFTNSIYITAGEHRLHTFSLGE